MGIITIKESEEDRKTMEKNFELFKPKLASYTIGAPFSPDLTMKTDGNIEVFYSPFDAINKDAKVCIVGISPGRTQAENANVSAFRNIKNDELSNIVLTQAKETASFSGALRNNLVSLLDYIGLTESWGLETAAQLFTTDKHLLHSTSVFRYPVLDSGVPISSASKALKTPILKGMIDKYLAAECESLSKDVLYIPLGKGTEDVLQYLADKGIIKNKQILTGLPHPSGANAERIKYFLGKKDKKSLSSKTNAEKLDAMKAALFERLSELGLDKTQFKSV